MRETTFKELDSKTIDVPRQAAVKSHISAMPLRLSLALFAGPALIIVLAYHFVRPLLLTLDVSPFESLILVMTIPMSWLFAAALIAYHRIEGRPLEWGAFAQRFRWPRLTIKSLLWAMGTFAACIVSYGLFSQIGLTLIENGIVPIPKDLPPVLDPRIQFSLPAMERFVGGTLSGNWSVVIAYFVMLFFNVVGEELWWRGYILPRQELKHGRRTWLIHGLMWTGFHAYMWWNMIAILPVCLIIAWVSQRLKNNWPALIAHYLINGMAFVMILTAVVS